MQAWTINELMHLTKEELCNLSHQIEHTLRFLEVGTVKRSNALTTLGNIRRVMALRGFPFRSS